MAEATQEYRFVAVESPLGPDALLLNHFSGREALGRPFEFELDLLSQDPEIDGNDIIGHNISVRMMHISGATRYFNGYVSAFRAVPGSAQFSQYELSMRPWLWFLSKVSDCRIFQEMKIPDVVKQVLALSAERIGYVSCNPTTLARDLVLLKEVYRMEEVQPVDLFPHTYHIESVVRLVKIS